MKQILSLSLLVCLILFNCKSKEAPQKKSNKEEAALLDTKWVLTKLNGDLVNLTSPELEQPFINLTAKDNGVNGNGGCNTFGGTFSLKEKQGIEFSQILATMRYCEDHGIENIFMGNLQKASTYTISDAELTFRDENGYLLLTFEPTAKNKQ